jgi:hypothetical protein
MSLRAAFLVALSYWSEMPVYLENTLRNYACSDIIFWSLYSLGFRVHFLLSTKAKTDVFAKTQMDRQICRFQTDLSGCRRAFWAI